MSFSSPVRLFCLSPEGIHCDANGLTIGAVPLLARDTRGRWAVRDERDLSRDLSRVYSFRVDVRPKLRSFVVVADALQGGNIAKAQIAALLSQLPDPYSLASGPSARPQRERLARDLVACGLLKADGDWDEAHPRTGTSPNPGWFAPKPKSGEDASSPGAQATAVAAASAADAGLLAETLPALALQGLARLTARASAAAIVFDTIFVPSSNRIVDEGAVPGRPEISYRWAHDEGTVTFRVLIDGEWRTLTVGTLGADNIFRNSQGEIVARPVSDANGRQVLVTTTAALDGAEAELRRRDGETIADASDSTGEPKLCPDPTPEPKTTTSENSIAYQEYVSKLIYGLAINVGGVNFDGCDPATGNLLEAKANIDHLFDADSRLNVWVYDASNPKYQMREQADTALAAGRLVVWHAQTWVGFLGLSEIADKLGKPNLSVVYDPN